MSKLITRAQKYINVEDMMNTRRELGRGQDNQGGKRMREEKMYKKNGDGMKPGSTRVTKKKIVNEPFFSLHSH
jgi:hypothetical protein